MELVKRKTGLLHFQSVLRSASAAGFFLFAVLLLLLATALLSPGVSAQTAERPVSPARQFDLQIQRLVQTLSQSLVTVQVASRTSPFQNTVINNTIAPQSSNGTGRPIYLRNVSAVVVDSGRYLICAAALLSDQDSLWLIRDGQRYPVERRGIDYRSGLALLETTAPNMVPASYETRTPSTGALALFLKTSGPESVEPTLTIASGASTVDGYLEFNGPVGSGTVGGAFFNMDGRLLGLALGSLSSSGSSNRVFVLPVSRIEPIVTRLKCCGDRQAGYLGVQVVNTQIRGLNLTPRRSYGSNEANTDETQLSPSQVYASRIHPSQPLSSQSHSERMHSARMRFTADEASQGQASPQSGIVNGALITIVEKGSPAQRAGVKVGDVVYRYDNQLVENASAFRDYVRGCAPDSVISLALLRGNQQLVVSAHLCSAPLQEIAAAGQQAETTGDSLPADLNGYNSLLNRIHQLEERLQALENNR